MWDNVVFILNGFWFITLYFSENENTHYWLKSQLINCLGIPSMFWGSFSLWVVVCFAFGSWLVEWFLVLTLLPLFGLEDQIHQISGNTLYWVFFFFFLLVIVTATLEIERLVSFNNFFVFFFFILKIWTLMFLALFSYYIV